MDKTKSIWDKIKAFRKALWSLVFAFVIYLVIYGCNFTKVTQNPLIFIFFGFITLSYLFIIGGFNTLIKKENILSKSIRLSYMLFCYILCALVSLILCTGLVIGIFESNKTNEQLYFLTTLFSVTLFTMIMLYIACFVFCLNMLKKELNCKYALFVSFSIKSLLLALASSIAIIAALSYLDIDKNYSIIYKNISIVVTMLYPIFDMYEYTYKKVDEYEKRALKTKKIIVSENYIG